MKVGKEVAGWDLLGPGKERSQPDLSCLKSIERQDFLALSKWDY